LSVHDFLLSKEKDIFAFAKCQRTFLTIAKIAVVAGSLSQRIAKPKEPREAGHKPTSGGHWGIAKKEVEMRFVVSAAIIATMFGSVGAKGMSGGSHPSPTERIEGLKVAAMCFYDYDTESGTERICYYECPTGTVAITIRYWQTCPVTIRR
jgi:hypothetical protein